MSTKELIEEANKLLASNWEDSEKELVKRMIDSLVAYKSLIPKSLKQDVKAMLQMANRIKAEYDLLLEKYKNEHKEQIEEENKEHLDDDIEIV
jgi:hypothetical protein